MNKKMLFVLISSLLSTGTWAGPPGQNTHGSTTTTISDNVAGADTCLTPAAALANNSDSDVSASALAYAMSEATSYIDVNYSGDVTLDLTRHGNHGAVHQVELNASMGSGTLFAQVAKSETEVETDASAYVSAEAEAAAELIAQALMNIFQGIDFNIDLEVIQINVKVGTQATAEAVAEVDASAVSSASATSGSAADSDSSALASAVGGGVSSNGSSFYVQGANIEEFSTQISAASGTVFNVQTDALAQVYADAMATSFVYAMAQASAEAQSSGKLTFDWDLPIIGTGSLPIVTDSDSAAKAAQQIANAAQSIVAYAQAAATSSASALGGSSLAMDMMVHYENLPGTEDLLEIVGTGNLGLNCTQATASANATADAETN